MAAAAADAVLIELVDAELLLDEPICDLFLALHSAKTSATFDKLTVASAVQRLQEAIVATPDMTIASVEDNAVSYVWRTQTAGFRDVGRLTVSAGVAGRESTALSDGTGGATLDGGVTIEGFARSWDPHVFTACKLPRWLACALCYCGVCPTADWGQNAKTLNTLMDDVRGEPLKTAAG